MITVPVPITSDSVFEADEDFIALISMTPADRQVVITVEMARVNILDVVGKWHLYTIRTSIVAVLWNVDCYMLFS